MDKGGNHIALLSVEVCTADEGLVAPVWRIEAPFVVDDSIGPALDESWRG